MGNQSSSSSSKLRHFRESWRRHKNGPDGQKNGGHLASTADKVRPPPQISHKYFDADEVEQLKECWSHMEGHLHDILSDSFLELFAEKPDIKDKFFEFRNYTIEDLRKHQPEAEANGLNALQRHVPRVSRAITKVVKLMDRPANAAEYLHVLGKIHHQMGITVQELSLFGPFFVSNSVRHLPSHLRERKFQELWIRFFAILIELLERGYPEQEIELDHREKALIRQTFAVIQAELFHVGEDTFLKLFQTFSTSKVYFPPNHKASPMEQLSLMEALENHGMLLIKVIDEVVKDLDNKHKLEQYFALLGRIHQQHRIAPQYLDVMGPIFCQTIRPVLTAEAQWDNEVRDAWHRLFRMMSVRMKSAYSATPNHDDPSKSRNGTPSHPKSNHVSPSRQSHSAQVHSNPAMAHLNTDRSPGQRLFQKNNPYHQRRRVSVDEINERKIRLQAQHCHILNHHKRAPLGGSALTVVPDLHDYNLGAANGGQSRSLARSHQDLRTGLTSPLSGPSAMLFKNASEAKAKACKERRTSLHQLVFGQRTKSLEKNNQSLARRERSRSEGLLTKYTVSQV